MIQIVPLHKPDPVFPSDSSFHLDSSFDHSMDQLLGLFPLLVIVKKYSYDNQ